MVTNLHGYNFLRKNTHFSFLLRKRRKKLTFLNLKVPPIRAHKQLKHTQTNNKEFENKTESANISIKTRCGPSPHTLSHLFKSNSVVGTLIQFSNPFKSQTECLHQKKKNNSSTFPTVDFPRYNFISSRRMFVLPHFPLLN